MKILILAPFLILLGVAGLVTWSMAGHGYHGYGMSMSDVSEMDENQDGLVTFDEFSAAHDKSLKSAFKKLDMNNDEVISKGEWDEFLKIHGLGEQSEG